MYKATKNTMKPTIQGCLIGCLASGTSCVIRCIENKVWGCHTAIFCMRVPVLVWVCVCIVRIWGVAGSGGEICFVPFKLSFASRPILYQRRGACRDASGSSAGVGRGVNIFPKSGRHTTLS